MRFWASSETDRLAAPASELCRRALEPVLNTLLEQSGLANFDCKLRYVPIIMPPDTAERYPARSRVRKRERICDCAPQLDFDLFVSGNFAGQLTEYVAGIRTSVPDLAKLGATKEQMAEFEQILSLAIERILANRLDQTRH
ncbi:hypothetical protein [Devosia sp.]|uniref:hypothetical protein n=1 Tax=Devosia sp. TaxID=1871048 RepID=UPI0029319F43|nr:hypothetical protein [Devosia sp.]